MIEQKANIGRGIEEEKAQKAALREASALKNKLSNHDRESRGGIHTLMMKQEM